MTMTATPAITGVASVAGFGSQVGAGSYVAIFGTNLAPYNDSASAPYSTSLDGVYVVLCPGPIQSGCIPLLVQFVSPGQVNAVMPTEINATGMDYPAVYEFLIVGNTDGISQAFYASINDGSWPSIFIAGADCAIDPAVPTHGQNCGIFPGEEPVIGKRMPRGLITDLNGQLVYSGNPARIGGIYVAWVTGLGATKATVNPSYLIFSSSVSVPAYGYPNPETGALKIMYIGQVSQFPGLYQVNFQIPQSIGTGPEGYGAWPCGDYSWELDTAFSVGGGLSTAWSNDIVIPLVIHNGDVPCKL